MHECVGGTLNRLISLITLRYVAPTLKRTHQLSTDYGTLETYTLHAIYTSDLPNKTCSYIHLKLVGRFSKYCNI